MKTALVIPALNEQAVIGETLSRIPPGIFSTVMVVDNGSSDKTAQVAAACGAQVVAEPNRGYGIACLRALASLPESIDVLVFMQADLSEDPGESNSLIAPIERGEADLVIGSRTLGYASPGAILTHQRFGNWLATCLIRLFYRKRYTDLGAFRAIRRTSLTALGMQASQYAWTVEMQVRAIEADLRVIEVPVSYKPRLAGIAKISGQVRASLAAGAAILSTIVRLWFLYRFPRKA